MKVFELFHQYCFETDDSGKRIGFYSTYEKALEAKKMVEGTVGFVDYPNDFYVAVFEVDKDWEVELIKISDH